MVSFFWPWVREEQIQLIDFFWSKYFRNLLPVDFEKDNIISPLSCTFFIRAYQPLIFELYTYTRHLWSVGSVITKKIPHACTDFEHQFVFSEKLLPFSFFCAHEILIRIDMIVFSNFLDVDVLVGHRAHSEYFFKKTSLTKSTEK